MRILLVSDLHSNRPALEAIREKFDLALCLGDLVEYGVEPGPCIAWTRQHCAHTVRGNHDHGAAHNVPAVPNNTHGFKYITAATRPLGRQKLAEDERSFLARLPLTRFLTLKGLRYLLVHATPRDPLDEFALGDAEVWAKRLEGIAADIVCVGHTHRPFVLEINGKLLVNPGSVGLQRDGDPRASYAILEGRSVDLRRIDYPIEQAVEAVAAASLPDDVTDLLTTVYREGKLSGPSGELNGYHGHIGKHSVSSNR